MANRVDSWLWSIRLYSTRSNATAACKGGHVRVNGRPAKASTPVGAGDRVEARTPNGDRRVLQVVEPVQKRVGAPVAATCFVDLAPPPPRDRPEAAAPSGVRDRGAGRPTKRDRRQIDRLRGRG